MKIRQDFVTNSSSSSFIIAFSKVPDNIEDVKKELFGDEEFYYAPYGNEKWSTDKVAETVFNDIKNQIPNIFEEVLDSIKNGWFSGREDIDYYKYRKEDGQLDFESFRIGLVELNEINDKKAENIVNEFIDKNGDKYIYTVSYADEDGLYYSALEHGNLFDKIPHIKTSYH